LRKRRQPVSPPSRFVLGQLLTHLDYLDEAIATLSTEIERVMAPFAEPLRPVGTIPGSTNARPK